MDLFKKIIKCLEKGGSVYESTTDFHVIAFHCSGGYNCLYLGVDKSVYLEIPALEIGERDLCFNLFDKEGEDFE